MNRIAILIGHSKENQGARSFLGLSEFEFNSLIAEKVQRVFSTTQLRTFEKEGNFVKEVQSYAPDLLIELHFNAFSQPILGCEALSLYGNRKAHAEILSFLQLFNLRFGIEPREVKFLKSGNDRGYQNLKPFKNLNCFIFEPCFGNFKTEDSLKIIGNPDAYAKFLIEYCNSSLSKVEKEEQNIMQKMIGMIQSWYKGKPNE